mgnify:CR=1 FL=1
MASRLIHCIAGCVLSVALPTLATAQTAKQCLTPKEAQGLVSFALPDVITSISTKCAPTLGPDEAKLELVVFEDFQCPFCAQHTPNLKRFHTRITQLPRFKEAWADDTKLIKWPYKFGAI